MSQQMGLWSYSQLTSLHLAFIKLPLSKFVAPESRGCLLTAKFTDKLTQRSPRPFATAQRTNGAAVPLYIYSLPNIVTGACPSGRRGHNSLQYSIATRMPQLAMNKTFALFPVGERPWSIVIKDGVQSENGPRWRGRWR